MSQFLRYSSEDIGAPALSGSSGSLVNVLDAYLVNGYGSKSPVGWLKPIANTTNPHVGCWQQPSGSQFVLYINDSGPNGSAGVREAWAVGWESISYITPPVGTGSGQFPLPSQLLTTGHVVVRKSADFTLRKEWVLFADDRTFYLFINPEDSSLTDRYTGLWFGDFYSIKSTFDKYKCMIVGRYTENSSTATGDAMDLIHAASNASNLHCFAARNYMGFPYADGSVGSVQFNKCGNISTTGGSGQPIGGQILNPNIDNGMYMNPIIIQEVNQNNPLRGWFRGMYQVCHPPSDFNCGQIITGANRYAGKSFELIKRGYNGGMWAIEISNTLDTNE
jgi:hypothetical protein